MLASEIEEVFNEQKSSKSLELILKTNLAILHFVNKNYSKALKELHEILIEEKNNFAIDQYNFIKIFQLIVHFEKGNTDILPYIIKSVYRHLLQGKKLYKVENALLEFLKVKLYKIKTQRDLTEAFKSLKAELEVICMNPQEETFMEIFDVISWLQSKIEKRPLEEILMEKSGYFIEK